MEKTARLRSQQKRGIKIHYKRIEGEESEKRVNSDFCPLGDWRAREIDIGRDFGLGPRRLTNHMPSLQAQAKVTRPATMSQKEGKAVTGAPSQIIYIVNGLICPPDPEALKNSYISNPSPFRLISGEQSSF